MAKRRPADGTPEFRVVVTRRGAGPLGPYRLAIAVAFALLVAGGRMWSSIVERRADDGALLRAALAAVFVWVVLTIIDNILGNADASARRTPPPSVDS